MRRDAAEKQCEHALQRRTERYRGGGIGLLMGSGMEDTEQTRRVRWRYRAARAASAAVLLVLCTAGGFASAKLWDGRITADLELDLAGDVTLDEAIDLELRKNALGRLHYFANKTIDMVRDARLDPELAATASSMLKKIGRTVDCSPDSLLTLVETIEDVKRPTEERMEALKNLHGRLIKALNQVTQIADDDPLRAAADERLGIIGRRIFHVGDQ